MRLLVCLLLLIGCEAREPAVAPKLETNPLHTRMEVDLRQIPKPVDPLPASAEPDAWYCEVVREKTFVPLSRAAAPGGSHGASAVRTSDDRCLLLAGADRVVGLEVGAAIRFGLHPQPVSAVLDPGFTQFLDCRLVVNYEVLEQCPAGLAALP